MPSARVQSQNKNIIRYLSETVIAMRDRTDISWVVWQGMVGLVGMVIPVTRVSEGMHGEVVLISGACYPCAQWTGQLTITKNNWWWEWWVWQGMVGIGGYGHRRSAIAGDTLCAQTTAHSFPGSDRFRAQDRAF